MSKEIKYELDNLSREKMSLKKRGSLNPNYGRPRDEATRERIAQSQRKSWERRKIGQSTEKNNVYFGNIEFNTQEEAINFFRELNQEHGRTIIITESKFEALIDFLIEKMITKMA
ncbi:MULTISPECIES: NUMOD3 domain-containing DNA-binding protein [Butyricimonas]|jgi:hypothetical protein|uniref:Nuclease associated modular domain-containing protein n=2 Tax=Butyricimonas TaxID=574697 RepID=A0ABR7D5J6_9BACT|nr:MULTISPECIES: NUMOD3 domain-containing DNA-binding protein [Odoribacteraceae]MBC5622605.1 hypothetical protein [Butyricimonas hominis]RHV91186.1 hypothetical protein DXA95_14050 [Odoribacter sp. OF09-27XD]